MRFGNYEFLKSNQWCYQMYKVAPDGWDDKPKTKKSPIDGRKMYRARGKAWESAVTNVDRLYWGYMRDEALSKAYGVAVCAANIRKVVAPTYPSADCAELRPKVLNRTSYPYVDKTE